MVLIGKSYSTNANGVRNTVLYFEEDFPQYYNNPEEGRGCEGKLCRSEYVGDFDCSNLKIGMNIEIYYDKAITSAKGTFNPIKKIEIVNK